MRHRKGFTLIELGLVVLIIGILVGLLLPALAAAVRSARRAAIVAEINGMSQGIASFQVQYGFVPPSRFIASETGDYSTATLTTSPELAALNPFTLQTIVNRSRIALSQIAPRMPVSVSGKPTGIAGIGFYDFNGNGQLDSTPYLLTGDECLVFFVGGVPAPGTNGFGVAGFAASPFNPFQPVTYLDSLGNIQAPPRKPLTAPFTSSRLVDLDGDGMPSYLDSINGSPLAFFSPITLGAYDPDDCNFATEPDGSPSPLAGFAALGLGQSVVQNVSSPAPNPYTSGTPLGTGRAYSATWINPSGFQIISAGADRQFGPGGLWQQNSPGNPLPFDATANQTVTGQALPGDARRVETDNLTNFSGGPLG